MVADRRKTVRARLRWRPRPGGPAAFAAGGAFLAVCALGALAACGRDDVAEAEPAAAVQTADGVTYSATTALLGSYPVRLRTTATVRNEGSRPVVVRFADACPVLLRALTREGAPRWDQRGLADCDGAGPEAALAPGAAATFETHATALEVLGDSLPDALYLLVAYLRPAGQPPVVLEAGRALLVAQRHAQER
jgi:hypothetical protein